ncbi:EF-hand domain-containing protein [Leisingera sp. ANG59]|uniref:EF-hand domain-containing protein n=1 Tax=Leisingera sp. ANG59 TaxID=2675221 RepID=UPI001574A778|nr:EF-hand domain-containing protein [Leisingera sp. ANG59]NSY41473.1 EF-hand domain-containing protein [Leisingera sp. ANG59]
MKAYALTAAAMAMAASAALAAMSDVDANEDGMASYEELTAVYPDVTEDQFTAMDANEDGSLDQEEMDAATEAGTLAALD